MTEPSKTKPWYHHKVFWVLGAVAVLLVASAAVAPDEKTDDAPATVATDATGPARVDAQREDHEAAVGQPVQLSGYTTTVTTAAFQQALNDFQTDGYLVADVTVVNRDDKAQPFSIIDWKLQTPQGQVLDPTFTVGVDQIGNGDLVKGGTVSGKVIWKVGTERGKFAVIYKPDLFDATRGIWPVELT